jgi:hypothetical protein
LRGGSSDHAADCDYRRQAQRKATQVPDSSRFTHFGGIRNIKHSRRPIIVFTRRFITSQWQQAKGANNMIAKTGTGSDQLNRKNEDEFCFNPFKCAWLRQLVTTYEPVHRVFHADRMTRLKSEKANEPLGVFPIEDAT